MNGLARLVAFGILVSFFPGCVTSQYTDDKGRDCTRRYFTPFGITTHHCGEQATTAAAVPEGPTGTDLKVEPLAPAPSLRQTAPAKAIEQNIRSATQPR